MQKKYIIFANLMLCFLLSFAQRDTEFWFAAPDITSGHAHTPILLCFASFEEPATVTISQPANPSFDPITVSLNSFDYQTVNLTQYEDILETKPADTVRNYGLKIVSSENVYAFYQLSGNNSEIYTLKGRNALGTHFIVPAQNKLSCSNEFNPRPRNSIEIVATQDNTTVTIVPKVAIDGSPANGPITITLNAGQSYSIRSSSGAANRHLGGTVITSDKPIAVNSTDDSVDYSGGQDLIGDQVVPVQYAGKLHIAIWTHQQYERITVFPTENNTKIYIDGSAAPVQTLNLGDRYDYDHTNNFSSRITMVTSDKPVIVWQLTGIQAELGGTQLPSLECTGSNEVVYGRSNSSYQIYGYILTKTENVGDFTVQCSNPNATLSASDFNVVASNNEWSYCYKNFSNYIAAGTTMRISNSSGKFHFGVLDYAGQYISTTLGFFSDYGRAGKVNFAGESQYCYGDTFLLSFQTEDVDSVVIIAPDGSVHTNGYCIVNKFTADDTGTYYIKAHNIFSCNEEEWTIDSINLSFKTTPEITVDEDVVLQSNPQSTNVQVAYCNNGEAALNAPYYITVRKNGPDGEVLKIDTVYQSLPAGDCIEHLIPFGTDDLCNIQDLNFLHIAVNCAGGGVAYEENLQEECNITDNTTTFVLATHNAEISGQHYVCEESSTALTCSDAVFYLWNTGETTQTINVSEAGSYSVTAYYSDGCPSLSAAFEVDVPDSPILDAFLNDMIAGDTATAVLGYLADDNLVLSHKQSQAKYYKKVFLPDGQPCDTLGCKYTATFTFEGYPDDDTIGSVDDILYLRLKMEHSYIRDLFINLVCPNNQNAYILKKNNAYYSNAPCADTIPTDGFGWFPGNNVQECYLGKAVDYADANYPCDNTAYNNRSGIGWNYCWSSNSTQGYQYKGYVYREANSQVYGTYPNYYRIIDSSDVAAGTNFYTPDVSFQNLVGCPINGTWKVEVIDGKTQDNGYIFECEIAIDDNILSSQAPGVVSSEMSGMWLTPTCDSTYVITPPYDYLQNDTVVEYTFTVLGDNGCIYDTTLSINVYANKHVDIYDTVTSTELPFTWNDSIFYNAGTKTLETFTSHGADSVVTMHLSVLYDKYTTICNSDFPFVWYGVTFAGPDTIALSYSKNGADSIVVMGVSIFPESDNTVIEKTVCNDQIPYEWNGEIFNESETRVVHLSNIYGCDSAVTMQFTVNNATGENITAEVLENDLPLQLNGYLYDDEGIYIQNLTNAKGCDSVLTINLVVKYNVHTTLDSAVCANKFPLLWNGKTFDEAATQKAVLTAASGVDSVVTMNVTTKPVPDATISGSLSICNDSIATLEVSEAQSYLWSTSDTTRNIFATEQGTYSVTVTNEYNCIDTASRYLKKYTVNPIADLNVENICAGEEKIVTVGTEAYSTVVISNNESTLSHTETIFLPDGVYCEPYGCSYRSPLSFSGFAQDAVVESVDDILYVRLNIEHSYAGDLYINITCPNGQKADILRFGSTNNSYHISECASEIPVSSRYWSQGQNAYTGTFFGLALDNSAGNPSQYRNQNESSNAPGTGWDYCWSNNASEGYQYASGAGSLIYRQGNIMPIDSHWVSGWFPWQGHYEYDYYAFKPSDVANGTQFYHPDQSFASLIGCPLNGSWYIEVVDGLSQDNGYVFEWELALAPHLVPVEYTDVTHVTAEGPWISSTSDTTFTISPPLNLEKDTVVKYLFTFFDDFGCSYDSVIKFNIFARDSVYYEITQCDSVRVFNTIYYSSGIYKHIYQNENGCDSIEVAKITITNSEVSYDSLFLVQNQLPYHFAPSDTIFTENSPPEFYFNYKLTSQDGCDSTIIQKVVIYQNTSQNFDTTVCHYDFPLLWRGKNFSAAGTFHDSTINSNGSTNYITYVVEKDSVAISNSSVTHVICYGASTGAASMTVFGGAMPLTYSWTDATGNPLSSTSQLQNASAGKYKFLVTDNLGCSAVDSVEINTINPPINQGNIGNGREVCSGENLAPFNCDAANVQGTYLWQLSTDGITWIPAPGQNNMQNYTYPTPAVDTFLLRRVFETAQCGTYYSDTVAVIVLNSKYDTIHDFVCQNQSYVSNGFNILPQETSVTDTLYFSKTISTATCDSIVTLELAVVAPKFDTITDFVCLGYPYVQNGFQIQASDLPGGGDYVFTKTYSTALCDSLVTLELRVVLPSEETINDEVCEGRWYVANGFSISPDSFAGKTQFYTDRVLQNMYGCDSVVKLELSVISTDLTIINHTADFCDNFSAELEAVTSLPDISWNTGEQSPSIIVTKPGNYTVLASDGVCESSESITIEGCDYSIYLPNAITPSIPGNNDFFCIPIQVQQQFVDFEITIFNRWGGVVFHSTDKNFSWDGKVNDKYYFNTVYNYIIRYTDFLGKPYLLKGSITVL